MPLVNLRTGFDLVLARNQRVFNPEGNLPALPADSWNLTVPAVVWHVGLDYDLFPTLALSLGERESCLRVSQVPSILDLSSDWRTVSLSPRERAGVHCR